MIKSSNYYYEVTVYSCKSATIIPFSESSRIMRFSYLVTNKSLICSL